MTDYDFTFSKHSDFTPVRGNLSLAPPILKSKKLINVQARPKWVLDDFFRAGSRFLIQRFIRNIASPLLHQILADFIPP